MIQFSQRFFRSYFLIPYLGLSRDLIPNIRLRFIETLPLVRHIIRIPTDQILLTKLVDVSESLALRDTDPGVVTSMNVFNKKHGVVSAIECCQSLEESEISSFGSRPPKELQKSDSQTSLTDEYLKFQKHWESLSPADIDKQKEEAEQKTQYFLLDPAKRPALIKATAVKKLATPTSTALRKSMPAVKKEVLVASKRESSAPISAISTKISNIKPTGTPNLVPGDPASTVKAKESIIPRVTKPLAKKGKIHTKLDTPETLTAAASSALNSKQSTASKAVAKPVTTTAPKKLK